MSLLIRARNDLVNLIDLFEIQKDKDLKHINETVEMIDKELESSPSYSYMPFDIFLSDAEDYVQNILGMPILICENKLINNILTPNHDELIAVVISPEQFEKIKDLL